MRRRRFFWPLVAVASLCLALAGASFAAAVFSDPVPPLPRGFATYAPSQNDTLGVSEPEISYYRTTEIFGRTISLSWSSDQGFLIAAILLGAVSLTTFGLAHRIR